MKESQDTFFFSSQRYTLDVQTEIQILDIIYIYPVCPKEIVPRIEWATTFVYRVCNR